MSQGWNSHDIYKEYHLLYVDWKDICNIFESSMIDGTKPKIKQALNNDTSSANPNVNINVVFVCKRLNFSIHLFTPLLHKMNIYYAIYQLTCKNTRSKNRRKRNWPVTDFLKIAMFINCTDNELSNSFIDCDASYGLT